MVFRRSAHWVKVKNPKSASGKAGSGGGLGALKQKAAFERPLSFEVNQERPSYRPSNTSKSD